MADIFTRSQFNPIVRPGKKWWKVYNPGAALAPDGKVHLYPRVMKKAKDWHSRIAHAVSADGEHFEWSEKLVLLRQNPKEKRGLEDPRITKIGDTYHMAFSAYDGAEVKLHTAMAKDLNGQWEKHGEALPNFHFFDMGGKIFKWKDGKPVEMKETKRGKCWSKSGAFFPQTFSGSYKIVFGEYGIWMADSKDGITFDVEPKPFIMPRAGTHSTGSTDSPQESGEQATYFDNIFVEVGPPPILTEKGWLILYHGIDEAFRYQLGFVLTDTNDPSRIIYRSEEPIFGPQMDYELGDSLIDVISGGVDKLASLSDEELKAFYKKARNENVMPQVVFCCGTVVQNGVLWLYYGAGDTSICTAWAPLKSILKLIK
ncbi:MAG: hypothetical protein HYV68_00480 [Candidatus Taylorbacteria bacterium]|nr:hypothetical protein [Candidatus Taylorbacteria bacterium]